MFTLDEEIKILDAAKKGKMACGEIAEKHKMEKFRQPMQ